ncbi:hypothetical protein CDAR_556811 [Caerostris darwini]|uniref:Uncharacterized protein n=1 Tax=Caerostris darwini TaxID=1538125 RepID=A0AAV4RAL5_9ARAC|nr:hypothetical protein CDAR_556811 [Caerostris darwini]
MLPLFPRSNLQSISSEVLQIRTLHQESRPHLHTKQWRAKRINNGTIPHIDQDRPPNLLFQSIQAGWDNKQNAPIAANSTKYYSRTWKDRPTIAADLG